MSVIHFFYDVTSQDIIIRNNNAATFCLIIYKYALHTNLESSYYHTQAWSVRVMDRSPFCILHSIAQKKPQDDHGTNERIFILELRLQSLQEKAV